MKAFSLKLFFIVLICFYYDAQGAWESERRGAILFMNYCSGCHNLRYLSWQRMVTDLQLKNNNSIYEINPQLRLSAPNLAHNWTQSSLSAVDAEHWFVKIPPDLSLIARLRGKVWIEDYLENFYPDPHARFGTNNPFLPNTMMPNILESLHQELSASAFHAAVVDIVYFLEYASDPSITLRYKIGAWVISFLALFCLLFWVRFFYKNRD